MFCIQGGHGTLSLAGRAFDIHLPELRARTVAFIGRVTAHGPAAVVAALCGAGAILLGLVLLAGAWLAPRPRRVVLVRTEHGTLGTLRRPLGRLAAQRAALPEGVDGARARARVHLRRVGVAEIVLRLLVSCLAIALIVYGAMLVLAALKLSPHTLNSISADHTIQLRLTSITAHNITAGDRIIVAASGVLCLLVFGPLAWRALPQPYLARTELDLADRGAPGRTRMAPRAIERIAEIAAADDDDVTDAAARYDSGTVDVQIDLGDDAGDLPGALRGVQARVLDALRRDGLSDCGVDITLAGLAR